ncbi:hypothetical protein DFH06DRAFT_609486 [Mycena polygramma]|nr:hypothetical protein DFH06DRAFT_609486 [Mycena polygramma]
MGIMMRTIIFECAGMPHLHSVRRRTRGATAPLPAVCFDPTSLPFPRYCSYPPYRSAHKHTHRPRTLLSAAQLSGYRRPNLRVAGRTDGRTDGVRVIVCEVLRTPLLSTRWISSSIGYMGRSSRCSAVQCSPSRPSSSAPRPPSPVVVNRSTHWRHKSAISDSGTHAPQRSALPSTSPSAVSFAPTVPVQICLLPCAAAVLLNEDNIVG